MQAIMGIATVWCPCFPFTRKRSLLHEILSNKDANAHHFKRKSTTKTYFLKNTLVLSARPFLFDNRAKVTH